MESQSANTYMDQVVRQQKDLERDLKKRACKTPAPRSGAPAGGTVEPMIQNIPAPSEAEPSPAGPAVDIRITGWGRWKNVIVPPTAYVVHTRRGYAEPIDCGLGISFRYNPNTDSFLAVPSSMQTILLNANCICRERQGILVQGYVQWIIEDFKTAYRKLDFTDAEDPMRVVNVQLREQAEAVIKDKVATMSIDDVLADKQPIIKELTQRLRHVAEGDGQDKGLGLKIVTVQIKEAVVSSATVWEMLQRSFRAERAKEARLAELGSEAAIQEREAEVEASLFNHQQSERARRAKLEAETLTAAAEHEREKMEKEAALARQRLEYELIEEGMRREAAHRGQQQEIALQAERRKVDNDVSSTALQLSLIQALPAIAEKLPHPETLKSIQIGGSDALSGLIAGLLKLVERVK